MLFIDLDLDVKFVTAGHVAYRCTCRIGYVRYQIIFECNGWGHLISWQRWWSLCGVDKLNVSPSLCRRSGLNPSSPLSGIFLHEPSWVSLRCREMIVLQISVQGFGGFWTPIQGANLPTLKLCTKKPIWSQNCVRNPLESALYTSTAVYITL